MASGEMRCPLVRSLHTIILKPKMEYATRHARCPVIESFLNISGSDEYYYAAYADIGIYDIGEYTVGDMSEGPIAQNHADCYRPEREKIASAYSGSDEAVEASDYGHHSVSDDEVHLCHGHVVFLVRFRCYEIQDCRRSLHAEKTSHYSAQGSCTYLEGKSGPDHASDPVLEETEV